jgi:glycosyltransferase involved in cell wall biosynthesis
LIYIANSSKQAIGGGWSFIDNLRKAIPEDVTESYDEASVYFITSATMVQRDEVEKAFDDGKKIILRVDNAVRNSRNRNTGMTRMYDFAQLADTVVYQSLWSKKYLIPFLEKDGPVIHNSVDESLFKTGDKTKEIYLYSRFNRDETKNWEVARYWYSQKQLENPDAELWIVGQFSQELIDGNFDFYNGERYKFWGVQSAEMMASLYAQAKYFIYTYFNDCYSNSLIEARMSGCLIDGPPYYLTTGGAPEIITKPLEYFYLERMGNQYKEII